LIVAARIIEEVVLGHDPIASPSCRLKLCSRGPALIVAACIIKDVVLGHDPIASPRCRLKLCDRRL
jgi:hypothetical protein